MPLTQNQGQCVEETAKRSGVRQKNDLKQGDEIFDEASDGTCNNERLSRQWALYDTTCYNIETKTRMGGVWKGVLAMTKASDTQKHSSLSEQGAIAVRYG